MKVWQKVQRVWQGLSRRERQVVRAYAKGNSDTGRREAR